jgi:hypothetical protein
LGQDQEAVLIVDSEVTVTLGEMYTFDAPFATDMYDEKTDLVAVY